MPSSAEWVSSIARRKVTLCFSTPVAKRELCFESLLRQGIILRPVKGYGFPRHLRMSVGLMEENEAAIKALRAVL